MGIRILHYRLHTLKNQTNQKDILKILFFKNIKNKVLILKKSFKIRTLHYELHTLDNQTFQKIFHKKHNILEKTYY